MKSSPTLPVGLARERAVRDLYASRLDEFRPDEMLLQTEHTFMGSGIRADMRTIDRTDVVRVWEFKLVASYDGLGQALAYWAQERIAAKQERQVKGVLAAFEIRPQIIAAVENLNLGLELVVIPAKLRAGGYVPPEPPSIAPVPVIPRLSPPPVHSL
jgi:hypothetical protein